MYFVYVDESGTKDPKVAGTDRHGNAIEKDWLYVLTGVALFEMRWFKIEYALNQRKLELIRRIGRDTGLRLGLPEAELRSNWVRIPSERAGRPFLASLTTDELTGLVDLYFAQLEYHRMRVFAVVIDKRYLHEYYDEEKLHRKAYELLLERVEWFMKMENGKHRALMVVDDTSRQMNRSLAGKHSYFQREGTSSGCRIGHMVELPMFVDSSLSNGVQLADLCSHSIYHAFRYAKPDYEYFERIEPYIHDAAHRQGANLEGLKVFPPESPLADTARELAVRRASTPRND
jgi:hypothetical protein